MDPILAEILQFIALGIIKHDLKILPQYFEDVKSGRKRFELRRDDRDFRIGDIFILREWNGKYTGRYYLGSISYILRGCKDYGLMDGYCIFGWQHPGMGEK